MEETDKIALLRSVLGDSFDYMVRTVQADPRIRDPHTVDIVIRKDGVERRLEADWLKIIAKIVKDVVPEPIG